MAVIVIVRPTVIARPTVTPRGVATTPEPISTPIPVVIGSTVHASGNNQAIDYNYDEPGYETTTHTQVESRQVESGPNIEVFILGLVFLTIALVLGLSAMSTAKNPKTMFTAGIFGIMASVAALIGVAVSFFAFS